VLWALGSLFGAFGGSFFNVSGDLSENNIYGKRSKTLENEAFRRFDGACQSAFGRFWYQFLNCGLLGSLWPTLGWHWAALRRQKMPHDAFWSHLHLTGARGRSRPLSTNRAWRHYYHC
jgi:hypothetical protein